MSSPIVRTRLGPVQGILKQTTDKFKYFLFQGIPFVQQPTADFKFRDPRPLTTEWTKPIDCTKEGPQAYSYELFRKGGPQVVGCDNALHINVFTPEVVLLIV